MRLNQNIANVALHVIACLLILAWAFFFDPRPEFLKVANPHQAKYFQIKVVVILMAAFYMNLFVFIPQIQKRLGWPIYLLALALIVLGGVLIIRLLLVDSEFRSIRQMPPHVFALLLMVAFSTSAVVRISSDKAKAEKLKQEKEFEAVHTELALLRSQISPHFMFNMLNTLSSLARQKSDQLEPVIVRLSQLMRYMLTNKPERKISLEAELDYLQSYLELQILRFGDVLNIKKEIQIENPALALEPMLLIPFIENAFKHGVGTVVNPEIEINLNESKGVLNFAVRNRFSPTVASNENSSGIGLPNVKKRLLLLYAHRHELDIATENNWYTVQLRLLL